MYLKRLEVQGFKSFAGKTEIDFLGGITGVVGPNGSGKSNISDALRWVLGEQSAKTLRGSKMEDIIFSGTNKRKPLGFAEVTLVLDNKDSDLPVDYSEVAITRRVFRSGESEYYINRTSCRLKDIRELFMDTGVGKDGYSIIGQGRIDEILSTKSEDRRNIFEEAAGIVKYKTRKEESEKKLEKTKENLVRITDIISELEGQLEPLEQQAIKAKEYLAISEKLKDVEVNLFIREIERLKEQLQHIESQKELLIEQIKFNEDKRDSLEGKYNQVKNEIDKMDKNLEEIQNLKYATQSNLEKNEGRLKVSLEKLSFLERESSRIEKDISEIIGKSDNVEFESESLKNHKEELEKQIGLMEAEFQDKNNKLVELVNHINHSEKSIEEKKSDTIYILNSIADKKSKINSLSSFNQSIEKRINQINNDIEELSVVIEKNNHTVSQLNIQAQELRKALSELIETKNGQILKRKDLETEKNVTFSQLDDLKGKIQGKISNYKLLKDMKDEYEGFYKSVRNALVISKERGLLGKGVKGVVAELITVEQKYEKAIEIALSSSLQNIVTETEEEAKYLINELKKKKLGRVTFLPMSTISGRALTNNEKRALGEAGLIGIACELIDFDKQYNNIFSNLLGRVLIVNRIEDGIRIAKKCNHTLRIVSLDGDVLNPGGSMTGGSYNSANTNLLGRERQINELEEDIKNLNSHKSNLELRYIKTTDRLSELDNQINKVHEEINDFKIKLAKLENSYTEKNEEKSKTENILKKYMSEKEQLLNEKSDSQNSVKSLENELDTLKEESNLIQSLIDQELKFFEDDKSKKDAFEKEITEIRVKAASYQQELKSINESLGKLEINEENMDRELGLKKQELHQKREEEKSLEKEIQVLKNDKVKINELLLDYELKFKELKSDKNNYMQAFYLEQDKLKEMNRVINDLQKSLNTLDIKYAKYNVQLENFNNKLWDDYEMTYQMALKYKRELDNISKATSEIKELKERIKSLGNINIDSIDEFKNVKERYEFMNNQKDDLINAKESLMQVIKDMEKKMKEQFVESFNIIKSHFSEVFIKLFGGGKADVFLQDEDNVLTSGIEIIAQPPGKKLQSLSLLSGGERALTAIALLFAILKTKPTPFCILDEIEAALDDANVYRYADYLREFSSNTQFIVITHRKGTMEAVDALYGVTMEEEGVSKLVSVKLSDKVTEIAS